MEGDLELVGGVAPGPAHQNQILAGAGQDALPGGGVLALAGARESRPFDLQDAIRAPPALYPG